MQTFFFFLNQFSVLFQHCLDLNGQGRQKYTGTTSHTSHIYLCAVIFFIYFFNHKNVSHHEFQFTSILTGKGNRKMCRNRSMFLKNTGVDFLLNFFTPTAAEGSCLKPKDVLICY